MGRAGEIAGATTAAQPLHLCLPSRHVALLNGRLLGGPVWSPGGSGWVPILYGVGWIYLFSLYMRFLAAGVWLVLGPVFLVISLTLLKQTAYTDPGILPRRWQIEQCPELRSLDRRLGLLTGAALDDTEQPALAAELHSNNTVTSRRPIFLGHSEEPAAQRAWCYTCEIYRPPSTSHCRTCDACVVGHDHHCWWLATCIGRGNHRSFLLLLWWAAFVSLLVLEQCIRRLAGPCPVPDQALDSPAAAAAAAAATAFTGTNTVEQFVSQAAWVELLSIGSDAETLVKEHSMCQWTGLGQIGAGWAIKGHAVLAAWLVGLYVADIAPSIGCLLALAFPAFWYFWGCMNRAFEWWEGMLPTA
jgi:hypothetical protein